MTQKAAVLGVKCNHVVIYIYIYSELIKAFEYNMQETRLHPSDSLTEWVGTDKISAQKALSNGIYIYENLAGKKTYIYIIYICTIYI